MLVTDVIALSITTLLLEFSLGAIACLPESCREFRDPDCFPVARTTAHTETFSVLVNNWSISFLKIRVDQSRHARFRSDTTGQILLALLSEKSGSGSPGFLQLYGKQVELRLQEESPGRESLVSPIPKIQIISENPVTAICIDRTTKPGNGTFYGV